MKILKGGQVVDCDCEICQDLARQGLAHCSAHYEQTRQEPILCRQEVSRLRLEVEQLRKSLGDCITKDARGILVRQLREEIAEKDKKIADLKVWIRYMADRATAYSKLATQEA